MVIIGTVKVAYFPYELTSHVKDITFHTQASTQLVGDIEIIEHHGLYNCFTNNQVIQEQKKTLHISAEPFDFNIKTGEKKAIESDPIAPLLPCSACLDWGHLLTLGGREIRVQTRFSIRHLSRCDPVSEGEAK
ncbi:hypothetical protein KAI46_00070 [bacterium]|nr:hypothetical protein [bacterium]